MKFLLTLLAITLFTVNTYASDDLRIGFNGTTKNVELRYTSKFKKNKAAIVTITNAEGVVITTRDCELICGDNKINLTGAAALPEGTYMVTMKAKNKTYTTTFIIWN